MPTSTVSARKKFSTLPDLCVSSLRRGHANLLCIVPILTDDPRRESNKHVPPNLCTDCVSMFQPPLSAACRSPDRGSFRPPAPGKALKSRPLAARPMRGSLHPPTPPKQIKLQIFVLQGRALCYPPACPLEGPTFCCPPRTQEKQNEREREAERTPATLKRNTTPLECRPPQ